MRSTFLQYKASGERLKRARNANFILLRVVVRLRTYLKRTGDVKRRALQHTGQGCRFLKCLRGVLERRSIEIVQDYLRKKACVTALFIKLD